MPAKDIARTPRRGYASPARTEQARQTRKRVIEAATRLFVQQGYATTTMRAIADAADVSVPTVELLFGTKAQLLHVVIDVAVAGDDEPVPVLNRAWAAEARSARDLADFLSAVAQVVGGAGSICGSDTRGVRGCRGRSRHPRLDCRSNPSGSAPRAGSSTGS